MPMVTQDEYAKKKAENLEDSPLSESWYPQGESNPCHLAENQVS